MSRIIIIGGHGKIARLASPILRHNGHDVTAIIRNPQHADDVRAAGAEPLVLNIEHANTEALAAAFLGYDVIVWAAGAGGGNPDRTNAVDRDAAIRAMDAAGDASVRRFVMVSYFGAKKDHGVPPENDFFTYAEAKATADEHLRASTLDWTILGPSTLTNGNATGRIDIDATEAGEVARADVAAVIAAVVDANNTIGHTITFNQGQTPISDAIASIDH